MKLIDAIQLLKKVRTDHGDGVEISFSFTPISIVQALNDLHQLEHENGPETTIWFHLPRRMFQDKLPKGKVLINEKDDGSRD